MDIFRVNIVFVSLLSSLHLSSSQRAKRLGHYFTTTHHKSSAAVRMIKRTASEAFAELPRSRSLSPSSKTHSERPPSHHRPSYGLPSPPYSPRSPIQSAPAILKDPEIPGLELYSVPPQNGVVNEDDDSVLYRILTGLEYSRAQHAKGRPVLQTTRFALNEREHRYPGSALNVLCQASKRGHATRVAIGFFEGDIHELWETGVPRPDWVTEGAIGGVHDPQWFYGIDAAQVKAGPFATEVDVKKAQATLNGAETRRRNRLEKSQKQVRIDWKLQEGLRRQELGQKMYDSDGNGSDDSLPASSVSDSSTTDYGDSDDEPLMLRLSKWKVTQQSRTPLRPPTTSSRRKSVSSDDSDAYVPSSTTNSDDSDGGQSRPTINSSNISQSRRNRSLSSNDDDEPLVTMFPK